MEIRLKFNGPIERFYSREYRVDVPSRYLKSIQTQSNFSQIIKQNK